MTIDDFREIFGNFDENRPLQAVEIGLFANSCLQNEKILRNITFLQNRLLYSKRPANSWPSSQKSRFLYRIILYDVGTALFFVFKPRGAYRVKEHYGSKPRSVRGTAHHEPLHVRAGIQP